MKLFNLKERQERRRISKRDFQNKSINSRNLAAGFSPYKDNQTAVIVEEVSFPLNIKHLKEERIRKESPLEYYGGAIYFSNEINVGSSWKAVLFNKIKSWINQATLQKKIDSSLMKLTDGNFGYTIKKGLRGRWYDPVTGTVFGENSYGIEIRGVPLDLLKDLGYELIDQFEQESVLLIDFETNRSFFLSYDDTEKNKITS